MIRGKIDFKSVPVQAGVISDIINLDIESSEYFQRLDDLIGADQGVASLVLRVVNSPLYSRGNKVGTIPLAISLLGYSVLRSLALLAFSRSLFSETRHEAFRLHIWQHSLLTALASQRICQSLGDGRNGDEAFIAGLMHDIGKVLMFTQHPDMYQRVFEYMFESGCSSPSRNSSASIIFRWARRRSRNGVCRIGLMPIWGPSCRMRMTLYRPA